MKWFLLGTFCICFVHVQCIKYSSFKEGLLPPKENCGLHFQKNQRSAAAGEFPWIVFIPLATRYPQPGAEYRCAGVLLSKRYVLTSEHCFEHFIDRVRLGQFNSLQNVTCDALGCEPVREVRVEGWVGHLEINLMLVRLAEDVEFTRFIQPICLPFDDFERAKSNETVYSSGWGSIQDGYWYSFLPKKIEQTVVSNDKCPQINEGNDGWMCVKNYNQYSHDVPCRGDDGSPIMYHTSSSQTVIEGILPVVKSCYDKTHLHGVRINDKVFEWLQFRMRP